MKKYLIHFMCADTQGIENDGIAAGTGFGILGKTFNTEEDAEKYLEEVLIPEDRANLENCYGITDDPELADDYEFSVEAGSYDRKQLVVYNKFDRTELNTTTYEIVGVEF